MSGGIYCGGSFTFILDVPQTYPFHAPHIRCLTRTWHPNIDPKTGTVLLPIVRGDWRPVLNINTVVYGLQLLFVEPNIDSACNHIAAQCLSESPAAFESQVRQTLAGGTFHGIVFEPNEGARVMKRKCSSMDALCVSSDAMRLDDVSSGGGGSGGGGGRNGSNPVDECAHTLEDGGGGDIAVDEAAMGGSVGSVGGGDIAGDDCDYDDMTRPATRHKRSCGMGARAAAASSVAPRDEVMHVGVGGGGSASFDGGGRSGLSPLSSSSSLSLSSSSSMHSEDEQLGPSSTGGGALAASPSQAAQDHLAPQSPFQQQQQQQHSLPHPHHPQQQAYPLKVMSQSPAALSTPPSVSSTQGCYTRPQAGYSGGAEAWQPGQHQNHFSPPPQQQQQQHHSFIKTFTSSQNTFMQDQPPGPPAAFQQQQQQQQQHFAKPPLSGSYCGTTVPPTTTPFSLFDESMLSCMREG
jgi:ubiquitin-protein ligase